jgi:hypothetical protein
MFWPKILPRKTVSLISWMETQIGRTTVGETTGSIPAVRIAYTKKA